MADIKKLKVSLESLIERSGKIMIFPHRQADFDAVASSLGMSLIATEFHVSNHVFIGDTASSLDHGVQIMRSEAKAYFPIINLDEYGVESKGVDLNILCDVNKPQLLLEEINPESLPVEQMVIIDHHMKDKETFEGAAIEHIDPTASSASEIITQLLLAYKMEIPEKLANYLLAGIRLDTNRTGNYSEGTSDTVTALLKRGASVEEADSYFIESFKSDCRVFSLVTRAKFLKNNVGIILAPTNRIYSSDELAKAANQLLKYANASYVIGKVGKGIIRVSARSRSMINIAALMQQIGGGGRPTAAAADFPGSTIEEVAKTIKKVLVPQHAINE